MLSAAFWLRAPRELCISWLVFQVAWHQLQGLLPKPCQKAPLFPPHPAEICTPQKLLLTPEREVTVELAILRDNGEVAVRGAQGVCSRA